MAEPLYLFDGYNLLHAGGFSDPQALVDRLAGYVAERGVVGIVVFDGDGAEVRYGSLVVRYAPSADTLLERLAAEHRGRREVILVSTDRAVRDTAGPSVRKVRSQDFAAGLGAGGKQGGKRTGGKVEDAIEAETRKRLEEWRRRRA